MHIIFFLRMSIIKHFCYSFATLCITIHSCNKLFVGARGEQGPQGIRGIQGEQGGPGQKGSRGQTGPDGEPGTAYFPCL